MKRLLFVALISAAALAQDRKTEAEELFEKAWWEETASGALDKALEGYRKAADATGPAAIRARSLYRAAIVEQRLGRTDAAVALLDRLAKDFPGETELLKEANARLQEWTAVDLRKSFSEWYRSYVYSPEFQARVVDLVLQLGSATQEYQDAWTQLSTIGEASVPALQEALKSSNIRLRGRATRLLLQLGVVPPTEALTAHTEWTRDGDCWLTLYRADEATRKRVREETKGDSATARAIRAVATSPDEMLAFVRGEDGWFVQYLMPILMAHAGEEMKRRVEALIEDADAGEYVVGWLRGQLPAGPEDADMRRLLDWARTLPTKPARDAAAAWAVRRLTVKSEEDLDHVLALVPGTEKPYSDLAVTVLDCLSGHTQVAELAWSPARVGVLLDLFLRLETDGTPVVNYRTSEPATEAVRALSGLIVKLPNSERAVALADALLDRAAQVRTSWLMDVVSMQRTVITALGKKRWQDFLRERMVARWPNASVEEKIALLGMATKSSLQRELREELRESLEKDAVARGTDPELQVAIVDLLGRIKVSDLLAAFDLSDADEVQVAVEALKRLFPHLARDGTTVVAMGQILIHGKSDARQGALWLLQGWGQEKDPVLLPAAKAVVADEAAVVRLWAVNRLAEWNSFDASPYLVKALADPDADVRTAAAGGLARVGREDAVPALIKLLDDPDSSVRDAALFALEQIRKIVEQKKAWKLEEAGLK